MTQDKARHTQVSQGIDLRIKYHEELAQRWRELRVLLLSEQGPRAHADNSADTPSPDAII